ncbi:MAG: integrase arm-type DNA-binding domain-containing protein, partial [Gammaproteobacteria bacterium]|nr:integrase arm-type DNA-binding domain-containing protein [Gammaproteobacteria bacterium]
MPLSDAKIRTSKPATKTLRLFDERGLYLEVSPNGGKWWRLKYRFAGKEKRISLGVYPDVGLKAARDRRDAARALLADGVDPSQARKYQKAAPADRAEDSFEIVAREWFAKYFANWAESHSDRIMRRLERDVFPWIGRHRASEVSAPQVLQVVRRIEERGALDTAHRALQNCGQIFRYAIATGRATHDPARDLRGALPPVKGKHFSAVTDPIGAARMLRTLDGYEGTFTVRCALRLAPLVFVRPVELRKAAWADIDLDAALWQFIVTKTNTPHIVPLSRQAVEILSELQPLTGDGRYVFPSARSADRPMSDN